MARRSPHAVPCHLALPCFMLTYLCCLTWFVIFRCSYFAVQIIFTLWCYVLLRCKLLLCLFVTPTDLPVCRDSDPTQNGRTHSRWTLQNDVMEWCDVMRWGWNSGHVRTRITKSKVIMEIRLHSMADDTIKWGGLLHGEEIITVQYSTVQGVDMWHVCCYPICSGLWLYRTPNWTLNRLRSHQHS